MKKTRFAVVVFLAAVCAFSWFRLLGSITSTAGSVRTYTQQGQAYQQQRLYDLAEDAYQQAIAVQPSRDLYNALLETCRAHYAEVHANSVKKALLAAYEAAVKEYPREAAYWEGYAQVYLDAGSYTSAAAVLRRAQTAHAQSDALTAQWSQAYYSYRSNYKKYEQLSLAASQGGYTAATGGLYGRVDAEGNALLELNYAYVSPAGEDGVTLCLTQEGEAQVFDEDGVMIGRFTAPIEEARGYGSGLLPVRLQGRSDWCYLDLSGNEVCGGFGSAGQLQNGTAAAQLGSGEWCLIGADGVQKSENTWQEVRLDESGCYRLGGVVQLKTDGAWRLYTTSGKPIGDFSAEDIDACRGGYIAFAQNGQWGFVDTDGNVVIAPCYEAARSFSGGVAAVCINGLWGFINESGELVIEPQFADAGYFDDTGACPVLPANDTGEWQFISWYAAR